MKLKCVNIATPNPSAMSRFYSLVLGQPCRRRAPNRFEIPAGGAFVVINGKQYGIAQTQVIKDALPECTDLTLEQPELLLDFDDTEVGGGGRF